MLQDKSKLLEKSGPRSIASRNRIQRIYVLQRIVVGEQDKLALIEIVAPVTNSSDNDIKFHIICTVTTTSTIQLLTEESNGSTLLAQNNTNADLRGITGYLKGKEKSGKRSKGSDVSFCLNN